MGLARHHRSRIHAALSAAVGLALVLSLARADYLVQETVGRGCGGFRDVVRWSLMVKACRFSDVDRFDLVNGGVALLAFAAGLNPTLVALRIVLLVPVLLYLSDAAQMRATFLATGRIYPGIELWWLPIFWLSALVLAASAVVAAVRWARPRIALAPPGVPHPSPARDPSPCSPGSKPPSTGPGRAGASR